MKKCINLIILVIILLITIDVEAGCSTKNDASAYCVNVKCSTKDESSCKVNTACCSWTDDSSGSSCTYSKQSDCEKKYTNCEKNSKGCWVEDSCVITGASFSYSYRGAGYTNTLTVNTSGNCKGKTFTYSKGCDGTSCTAPNRCGSVDVTVSYGNSSKTASYTAREEWKPAEDVYLIRSDVMKLPLNRNSADLANKDVHGIFCTESVDDPGVFACTGMEKRCGSGIESLPDPKCYRSSKGELRWTRDKSWGTKTDIAKKDCNNCYANASSLEEATRTNYGAYGKANSAATPHFIKNRTEEQCFPEYKFCKPEAYESPTKDNKTTTSCEGDTKNTTFTFEDGKACTGNAFYEIKCNNTVSVNYDNEDDSSIGNKIKTINSVLVGEGFRFGIKINANRSCTGTFNKDVWLKAYNRMNTEHTYLKSESCNSSSKSCTLKLKRISWLETMMDEMIDFVNEYNSYSKESKVDEKNTSGNISVQGYKINGIEKNLGANFVVSTISKGAVSYSYNNTISLGVSGVTNPKNYHWSSTKPKIIKLYLPAVYIEKTTAKLAESGINAGNKLFTDYESDLGKYNMNINVSTYNRNSINNKCILEIVKSDYAYRPIDITNPFINDNWKKGENWSNKIYDFTKTIHKDTWKEKTYSTIDLKASNITVIRKSNSNNVSSYLGLCDKVSESSQDAGTRIICQQIRNIK